MSSADWWMYHHDEGHSGLMQGASDIWQANVGRLQRLPGMPIALVDASDHHHHVLSVPSIVADNIYVGTATWQELPPATSPGALYQVDLRTGKRLAQWAIPQDLSSQSRPFNTWGSGFAASPAVVAGRVYITSLDARAFCFDANAIANGPLWVTDLLFPDPDKNQPLDNSRPAVACWTSPLVVDGKVYLGTGLGEGDNPAAPFGFIYCLDAATGRVTWLFCTNKFIPNAHNLPDRVPASLVGGPSLIGKKLPAPYEGYVALADPPSGGASVWSSCAYGSYVEDGQTIRTIYAGTSNVYSTLEGGVPLPGPAYSSGVLALDADSGRFRAYYQPSPADSYRPDDSDVDVGASPLVFYHADRPRVALGNKAGSFFLLDGLTLQLVAGPRQLLPRLRGDGFPQTIGAPLKTIDVHGRSKENPQGVMGTAAYGTPPSTGVSALFVPLAGSVYPTSFLRALNAATLGDAWPTEEDPKLIGVTRYSRTAPPMYDDPDGPGAVSNPAVVNDLVFISAATPTKPSLYALAADTGEQFWSDSGFGPPSDSDLGARMLGPAISGNFVVAGYDRGLFIYRLLAGWQDWFVVPHGAAHGATGTPVTALWRGGGSDHLDLFVVDQGGNVLSNFWEPPTSPSPGWQSWFPVPPHAPSPSTEGAAVTAVWRGGGSDHLDLFVVDGDGNVLSNFWEPPTSPTPGWQSWFRVPKDAQPPTQKGARVTALWRGGGSDRLDLFVADGHGNILSNFWEPPGSPDPGWHSWRPVPHPTPPTTAGAPITALWRGGGSAHLDLFVIGADGNVMSNYRDGSHPNWFGWFPVPHGRPRTRGGSAVEALWRGGGSDHLDLFVVGDDGSVVSNYWEPASSATPGWQSWFSVLQDTPPTTGEARVTAAWRGHGTDHLDLFVAGADGSVMSNYWEPVSPFWHTWFRVPHGTAPTTRGAPVAAVWRGGGSQHLDLFVVDSRGTVRSNYWGHP